MRLLTCLAVLIMALGCLPARLSAQVIRGELLDGETEEPIRSATIQLLGSDNDPVRSALTDSAGKFTFAGLMPGRYRLRAERIGYQQVTSPPLDLQRHDSVAVELRMSTQAVLLAPLTVRAAPRWSIRNRGVDGFYERRSRGRGRFFTPEDVVVMRPVSATQMLQGIHGVSIRYPRMAGERPQVLLRSAIQRLCTPTLYVDGHRVPMDAEVTIDDWIMGGSLRALEVYRSRLETPAEFLSANDCGVIVAWTQFTFGDGSPQEGALSKRAAIRPFAVLLRVAIAAGVVAVASLW